MVKAFTYAKSHALSELVEVGALNSSLPWLPSEIDETVALLGRAFWSYGVKDNEATLNAFLGHHHVQGLSARKLTIPQLFVPSAMEQFVI